MEEAKKMEKWMGRIQPISRYRSQSERPAPENWKREFAVNFIIIFQF